MNRFLLSCIYKNVVEIHFLSSCQITVLEWNLIIKRMNEIHKKLLDKNIIQLSKILDFGKIEFQLLSLGVLLDHHVEVIQVKIIVCKIIVILFTALQSYPTRLDKTFHLLKLLKTRGPDAFGTFCTCLGEHRNIFHSQLPDDCPPPTYESVMSSSQVRI